MGAQNIGTRHNAHPAQLKLTAKLQFIFVDAVDKPHCRLVDGNAVRAAVYTVCDGHPQEHHADAINGHGKGVLIFQPLILRQACQRHAPPQCAFVVGAVQAVLDREPPGKGCAPLDQRVKMMVGRVVYTDPKTKSNVPNDAPTVLEVKNMNSGNMVKNVSFKLRKGEILGFAGLMGAGRTETTRAIFGVDPKDGGELYVDGKKIEVNCPMDAIRNGVVLAPEDRKKDGLCTKLSIRQNLALPNLDLVCNKMGVINSGKEDALCEKAVKDLRIKTPNVEIDSGNLSGGNQQKVVVGKWLARDSRVVIFDEPTRGIDVGAKVEIYNLMNELKKQGIAVMFVSSEMPEVMGIADRIIVMCDGRITGEVSAREATQDEILTMATSFENKGIKETEGGSKNE